MSEKEGIGRKFMLYLFFNCIISCSREVEIYQPEKPTRRMKLPEAQ